MSEIKLQKYENQKSLRYLSGAASILGGTQYPNRWHCRDPHGKVGQIECSFDLKLPSTCQDNGATRDGCSKETSILDIYCSFFGGLKGYQN
jgi:hypothetical protein